MCATPLNSTGDTSMSFREYRYQVQVRDCARLIAEYAADGVSEYANTEWTNRLKKSYPMKSAHKEFNYCIQNLGRSQDIRIIDTKTGRVLDTHIPEVSA